MDDPIKIHDLRVPLFLETPICSPVFLPWRLKRESIFPPIIMVQRKMGVSPIGSLPFKNSPLFHFHDYGRKSKCEYHIILDASIRDPYHGILILTPPQTIITISRKSSSNMRISYGQMMDFKFQAVNLNFQTSKGVLIGG